MGVADLHVHTSASWDANACVEDVLVRAESVGLDVIAITDHNTTDGALEAAKIAARLDNGVEVIVGEELDTQHGHLLGLFLRECIPPRLSFAETILRIHEQGGLAIVPHPGGPLPWHATPRRITGNCHRLDGLEVSSTSWFANVGRKGALHRNRTLYKLALTGGSDAHCLAAVGQCVTLFPGHSAEDLRRSLVECGTTARGEPLPLVKGLYALGVRAKEAVGKARFVETPYYESLTTWARQDAEEATRTDG